MCWYNTRRSVNLGGKKLSWITIQRIRKSPCFQKIIDYSPHVQKCRSSHRVTFLRDKDRPRKYMDIQYVLYCSLQLLCDKNITRDKCEGMPLRRPYFGVKCSSEKWETYLLKISHKFFLCSRFFKVYSNMYKIRDRWTEINWLQEARVELWATDMLYLHPITR